MAVNPKDGKLLYHLTAFDNIHSILKDGLLPRGKIKKDFKNVADEEILKNRKRFDLAKFTPFHFFSQSPFAGSAQKANLSTEFVYITITRAGAEKNKFKVVPKHPLNFNKEPLDWSEGIKEIDWELISSRDYSNHDCKEACMAECLYEGRIAAKHFHAIYVRTEEIKSEILTILKQRNLSIRVNANPGMFVKK